MMNNLKVFLLLFFVFLSACSTNNGRYQHKNDSTPSRIPSASELIDATPRIEPHSRGGNKNYTVRGKHYQVLKTADGFQEQGIASWYGQKFHGHLTSNGEIYDMYAMSAAHKNLPLPTYVKVTNNDNGRSVIVRVNDRGPFHQSRVIDLSYSAAYKLDMLKTGTANVTIKTVTANAPKSVITPLALPKTSTPSTNTALLNEKSSALLKHSQLIETPFIQIFASKSSVQAQRIISDLFANQGIKAKIQQVNGIFRVIVGQKNNTQTIEQLLQQLKAHGFPHAFIKNNG